MDAAAVSSVPCSGSRDDEKCTLRLFIYALTFKTWYTYTVYIRTPMDGFIPFSFSGLAGCADNRNVLTPEITLPHYPMRETAFFLLKMRMYSYPITNLSRHKIILIINHKFIHETFYTLILIDASFFFYSLLNSYLHLNQLRLSSF